MFTAGVAYSSPNRSGSHLWEKKEMETTRKGTAITVLLALILLSGALVAMQAMASDHHGSPAQPSATAWQHLALTQTLGQTPDDELARNINRLGREGWELVSVGNITQSGTTIKTVFYFKKPL
jgi:hypothetical protein